MRYFEPTNEIHYAGGDMVHLLVAPDQLGGWKATILGGGVAQAWFLENLSIANSKIHDMFQRAFPGHICCKKCRALRRVSLSA
jgi:hypothetical protein